jgi:hypothetical protein
MPDTSQNDIQANAVKQRVVIDSLAQFKQETSDIIASAKQKIQIYSHGLYPRILNNRKIEKKLLDFVKRSRNSRIQILIYDEGLLRGIDHRLVALAQRFTSYVEIRTVPRDFHENPFGFYLVDDHTMIYRSNVERYEAEKLHMPNFIIKDKSKLFHTIWQSSSPASFLRALHI